jgi:hypothetical protein
MAVHPREIRWQQQAISAQSDLRGLLALGLLAAWWFCAWKALQQPAFAGLLASADPLLQSLVAKGRVVLDLGLIVMGMALFHFRRQFRRELRNMPILPVIRQSALWLGLPLVVVLVACAVVKFLGNEPFDLLWPWLEPSRTQFFLGLACLVLLPLLPWLLHKFWTVTEEVPFSMPLIAVGFYGLIFWTMADNHIWSLAIRVPFAITLGFALMGFIFRVMKFVAVVRGHGAIVSALGLIAGSILRAPGLFFLSFVLLAVCFSMSERSWRLPGEGVLLAWSRTAPALFLAQPVVLLAWSLWGARLGLSPGCGLLALAVLTQLLAIPLYLGLQRPVLRRLPVPPAPA